MVFYHVALCHENKSHFVGIPLIWTPTWSLKKGDAINWSCTQNWSGLTVKPGFSCVCFWPVTAVDKKFNEPNAKSAPGKVVPQANSRWHLNLFRLPDNIFSYSRLRGFLRSTNDEPGGNKANKRKNDFWKSYLKVVISVFVFFGLQKLPNFIMGLNTMGTRIVVSDIQESFHFVKYKARENHLVIFADDVNPR